MTSSTVFAPSNSKPVVRLGTLLRRSFATSRALTLLGVGMLLVLLGTLVGLVVDPLVLTGVPAWIKPAKFAISLAIYAFTVVYLLGRVTGHPRLRALVAGVTAVTAWVEMVIIAGQVVRGTTSHFNFSTPLDGTLFGIMGISIVLLWTAGLVLAALLLRQPMADRAFAWSLRLGMLLALVGMAIAFMMTRLTPLQTAALKTGGAPTVIGAHSVGVADGGPGLPLLGWSTVGGDLRIPHFVGIHAIQVLLVLGLLLARSPAWLTMRHRVALVWAAGAAYLGLLALLTWQALRGQPLIAPDGATLLAGGLLATATVLSVGGVLLHARAGGRTTPQPA